MRAIGRTFLAAATAVGVALCVAAPAGAAVTRAYDQGADVLTVSADANLDTPIIGVGGGGRSRSTRACPGPSRAPARAGRRSSAAGGVNWNGDMDVDAEFLTIGAVERIALVGNDGNDGITARGDIVTGGQFPGPGKRSKLRALKKALGAGERPRLKVTVEATDAAGNTATAKRTVRAKL